MSDTPELEECLKAIEWAGVPPAKQLALYVQKVLEWNAKINITGAKDAKEFAVKHVADVWRAISTLGSPASNIVDVGSGGGIPGIVIAIMQPGTSVTLVERRQKKAGVLSAIVDDLGLAQRVKVLPRSFEEVARKFPEDAEFWFRGFLPGPKLAVYLSEFFPRADLGRLVLMKGPAWPDEKLEIMSTKKVKEAWAERFAGAAELQYQLPQEAGERMLVLV